MPKKPDLVGATDIASRLGCDDAQIYSWQGRHTNFPKPWLVVNKRTKIWLWSDIVRWITKTGRSETFPIPEEYGGGK